MLICTQTSLSACIRLKWFSLRIFLPFCLPWVGITPFWWRTLLLIMKIVTEHLGRRTYTESRGEVMLAWEKRCCLCWELARENSAWAQRSSWGKYWVTNSQSTHAPLLESWPLFLLTVVSRQSSAQKGPKPKETLFPLQLRAWPAELLPEKAPLVRHTAEEDPLDLLVHQTYQSPIRKLMKRKHKRWRLARRNENRNCRDECNRLSWDTSDRRATLSFSKNYLIKWSHTGSWKHEVKP